MTTQNLKRNSGGHLLYGPNGHLVRCPDYCADLRWPKFIGLKTNYYNGESELWLICDYWHESDGKHYYLPAYTCPNNSVLTWPDTCTGDPGSWFDLSDFELYLEETLTSPFVAMTLNVKFWNHTLPSGGGYGANNPAWTALFDCTMDAVQITSCGSEGLLDTDCETPIDGVGVNYSQTYYSDNIWYGDESPTCDQSEEGPPCNLSVYFSRQMTDTPYDWRCFADYGTWRNIDGWWYHVGPQYLRMTTDFFDSGPVYQSMGEPSENPMEVAPFQYPLYGPVEPCGGQCNQHSTHYAFVHSWIECRCIDAEPGNECPHGFEWRFAVSITPDYFAAIVRDDTCVDDCEGYTNNLFCERDLYSFADYSELEFYSQWLLPGEFGKWVSFETSSKLWNKTSYRCGSAPTGEAVYSTLKFYAWVYGGPL